MRYIYIIIGTLSLASGFVYKCCPPLPWMLFLAIIAFILSIKIEIEEWKDYRKNKQNGNKN